MQLTKPMLYLSPKSDSWDVKSTFCTILLSKGKRKGSIFKFFHYETRFQKSVFTGTAFAGSMWMIGQKDATRAFTQKSIFMSMAPEAVQEEGYPV